MPDYFDIVWAEEKTITCTRTRKRNERYKTEFHMYLDEKMRRELGNPEKAAKCKADCEQNGWVPVSMRDEWWTIYGPQVERN